MQSDMRWLISISLATILAVPGTAAEIEVDSVLIRLIDEVDVPARVLGALVDVHVEEGVSVTRGQMLAQIDDTEARLGQQRAKFEHAVAQHEASDDVAIRSAKTSWEFTRADYMRLRRAEEARPRSVSDSELEKARHDADQAELEMERARSDHELSSLKANLAASDLELAERNVEIRKIVAPLDGVVVSVSFRSGEWVKPGDKVFRIVRTDRLRAEGFVAAADVLQDLRGCEVVLEPELGQEDADQVRGEIVFVSPEIDPVNGQVRVWAEVENPKARLRPGLRATMKIKTDRP